MELVQCVTCGAHSMTNGKCDYCGNQYEVNEDKIFYGNSTEDDSSLDEDITFQETFFFNDTATTEIYTELLVGSVRCV